LIKKNIIIEEKIIITIQQ